MTAYLLRVPANAKRLLESLQHGIGKRGSTTRDTNPLTSRSAMLACADLPAYRGEQFSQDRRVTTAHIGREPDEMEVVVMSRKILWVAVLAAVALVVVLMIAYGGGDGTSPNRPGGGY